jgi:23S rRNA (pseudouridine1915-N3)-methyltransferase
MKLHLLTVGEPKLEFAKEGWDLYLGRLQRYHTVRTTHVPDKHAYDAAQLRRRAGESVFTVAMAIEGKQMDSPQLANFLGERALDAREVCFMIGGPEGLPSEIIEGANARWSLSKLTFPHDLAMVVLAESLYRASTINAGHPYHKG